MMPEANHLEAYKFSLFVGNNAGGFQPTNQNHGIFFAQIWNQRIEVSLLSYFFVKKYLLVGASSMLWTGQRISESESQ